MTDEERLERLKKISDNVSLNGAMSTHLRLADLLFLIGQAERAQELEETMLDANEELFRGKRGRALDIIEGWGERNG